MNCYDLVGHVVDVFINLLASIWPVVTIFFPSEIFTY